MPARTDGRWTMTMMTRTDCPCVRLSVREARASVGLGRRVRSFVVSFMYKIKYTLYLLDIFKYNSKVRVLFI